MTVLPVRLGGHAIVVLLGLLGIAAIMTATLATASSARAATAYRYWAYYVGHGSTWQYATRGPATEYPVDGEVQGWRFAAQVDAGNGLEPESPPTFSTLCASTPVKAGDIRVGIVIDFGSRADAPAHEHPPAAVVPGCVSVPTESTGLDVLQAAARVRIGTGAYAGLVCGLDGYPAAECATAVTTPEPPPVPAPTHLATPSPPPQATTAEPQATTAEPQATTAEPSLAAASAPLTAAASRKPSTPPSAVSSPPVKPTLASLRTADHHRFPVMTIVGGALVVALGGGAVWRARAGRR